jgi:nucleoside-triphosphatase
VKNFLLTGRPGSGKSTIIQQLVANLKKQGVKVGGLFCPEIRGPSGRLGFKIIELMSGEERILAYVGQTGPKVGKYGVNLNNLDEMSRKALETLPQAEVVVIDEIGPMEVRSSLFCDFVRKCLDSNKPVLSAIHKRTESGFIGEIKRRKDVMIFEITPEKRKEILEELREKIEALLNLQK